MSETVLSPENPLEAPEKQVSAETQLKVETLSRIVSEAAEKNEKPPRSKKTPGPVRAGGRPRRGGAPNKATLKLMGLDSDPLAAPPGPGSAAPPPSAAADPAALGQALDIPVEMLPPILKLPFDLMRAHTGFDGFRLDDEVAKNCAPLLQHVIKQYLPEVNSPHAPAVILCTTLGFHLAVQSSQFAAWKKSQSQKKPEAAK